MDRLINYEYLTEANVSCKKHIPIWLEFGIGLYRSGGSSINPYGCHLMTCYKPYSNLRKNIYIVDKRQRSREIYENAVKCYKRAEERGNTPISNVNVEDFERYGYEVHTISFNYY